MNFFKNKKIIILGGAGSIGSALVKKISEQKPKLLVALDNNEERLFNLRNKYICTPVIGDIRDEIRIKEVIGTYRPEIVINAAALKHVGLCEENPVEAWKTNVEGLKNVLHACDAYGVKKMVYVSTDKAVNPKCVMGKTKLEGEKLCLAWDNPDMEVVIVRFGNVVNSSGSVYEIWLRRIEEGLPLIVNHKKMRRYFMGIFEAVDLILKAVEIGKNGEKIILDMGDQKSIKELAQWLIKISRKDLKIIYSKPSKGEKFEEKLMTKNERSHAIKSEKLWIIKK